MVIRHDGNVGIRTTNPHADLHIVNLAKTKEQGLVIGVDTANNSNVDAYNNKTDKHVLQGHTTGVEEDTLSLIRFQGVHRQTTVWTGAKIGFNDIGGYKGDLHFCVSY